MAYCGLADSYALLGFRGGFSVERRVPCREPRQQRTKCHQNWMTLSVNPQSSLAFIAETYEWDWATAEREYKRALELNPGDARTHHWYAGYLMYVGRFPDEGIADAPSVHETRDPLSLPVTNALAGRLLVAGRVDQALVHQRETLKMNLLLILRQPTRPYWPYRNKGYLEEAIQEFQQALQLSGTDDKDIMLDLGFGLCCRSGQPRAGAQDTQATKNLNEQRASAIRFNRDSLWRLGGVE